MTPAANSTFHDSKTILSKDKEVFPIFESIFIYPNNSSKSFTFKKGVL